jgi:plasmid stabilization system protein ParE
VEKNRRITWNLSAADSLINLLSWIKEHSLQGAEIVEQGIYTKLEQALKNPLRFPPDKHRLDNTGNFRCFVSHSYSITYEITESEIRVVRIVHVKQKPQMFS